MIIHTNDNTSKANTTDIYIDGINIGNSINNSSKETGISRIEIFSGTKDMLDFSIDNLIVYAGEKLPKGAEPVIKSSKNTEIVTSPINLKTLTGKTIDFDNLKAGVQIDSTSDYWSVQKVNGTTMIAEISTTESKSAPNSLYLLDNSSSDKPYALLNFPNGQSAKGTVSFSSFIPSTNAKTVYVNIGVGKNNSDRYIELRLQGSGLLQYENGSDDKDIGRFTTDEWHTFAVTWENGLFTVFVDGIPSDNATDISVKSTGLSTSNIPKTITFYVGDKSSTGTIAYIDDIKSDQF